MKKVLALSLVFALFTVSISAQNEKTENLRRHPVEQRLHNRDMRLKHQGTMNQRHEIRRHQLMKQHMMRNKAMRHGGEARKMRRMELQHHRKMMHRRRDMHRRVI
jgi:hypothetical protein